MGQGSQASDLRIIEPPRGWVGFDLAEAWRYRELLLVLARRNILVRYKQSVLGAGWAVIQPVLLMVVFTLVFGRVAGLGSKTGGVPYPIFTYSGLLPWLFFANSLTQTSNSLVGNAHLITKVYFPRIVIPLAQVIAAVVDLLIAFVVLIIMELAYGIHPRVEALFAVPLLLVLAAATALGAGLWLAALNVSYRDVQYLTPFLTQIWFFITPVVYPASRLISGIWRTIYGLNPMAGVTEGFRWAMINSDAGAGRSPLLLIAISALVAVVLLVSGVAFFRHTERLFADVV